MRVLISVFLLHLHLFGYIGAALGTDQMCAIPTSDDTEFETVELIFKDVGELGEQLKDPKMQEYLRKHFTNNGGSCKEQETTTTITTTVTTGSAQPLTITTDNDGEGPTTQPETTTPLLKETTTITETSQPTSTLPNTTTDSQGISTTNMETTEPAATSAQTTQAEDTIDTKMKTTEPAVTSAGTTQANVPTTETSTEISTGSATTQKPCPPFTKPTDGVCEIIYDDKCYIWYKGSQKYTLEMAKQWCEKQGFDLGNIYDDCHYSYIVETVGKTVGTIWTGMNISFTSEGQKFWLRSGAFARFSKAWWYKEYPKVEEGNNLLFEVKMRLFHPHTMGITNEMVTRTANGAFCEKDI